MIMGYFIPQTLMSMRRWVLWKPEDGKKVPFSVCSTEKEICASTTNDKTWACYGDAVNKLKYSDFYGLGFVFSRQDGLVFIDLDSCVDESGELSEFADSVVKLFADTYVEYSQSETGLHIVAKGSIPKAIKRKEIEIYSDARYMAFTGNAYNAAEPQPSQAAIDELIRRIDTENSPCPVENLRRKMLLSDQEVLQMAHNGSKGKVFDELWAGEWKGKFPSQSEADIRLIGLLYYYSRDYQQVERLFLQSGLGKRKKAQNHSYVLRTIVTAAKNDPINTGKGKRFKCW